MSKKKPAKATKPTTQDVPQGIDEAFDAAARRAAEFIMTDLQSRFIGRVEALEKRVEMLDTQVRILVRASVPEPAPWWRFW